MIRLIWREASPRLENLCGTCLKLWLLRRGYRESGARPRQGRLHRLRPPQDRRPDAFKLWDVTKRLLAENCNGKEKLAFRAKNGGPLMVIEPDAKAVGAALVRDRERLRRPSEAARPQERLLLEPRDTSSTKVESIDRSLTDLFDGHKDGRMARFYVDGSKIDYDQMFSQLDKAIDELDAYYGLELPVFEHQRKPSHRR